MYLFRVFPRHIFWEGGEGPDDVGIEAGLVGMAEMGIMLIDPSTPTPMDVLISGGGLTIRRTGTSFRVQ